jgi:hypothetical protein
VDRDANQRLILVKGQNLLFLREPVSVTGSRQEPWNISTQSDSFLMIYDPHWSMDSGQGPKDVENAISSIFIKTAFGEINHLILPPEVCLSFLRARIKTCPLTGICVCVYIYIYSII